MWVAHTHAFDAAQTTPYLNISSAEKQCGKTRLLEVLCLLVANPWLTGSASRAALVRRIEAVQPTLLLDESDAAFSGDREYAEALRALLNCGHSRDGVVSLCVGMGANITFKDFRVFCPKAIAGIGKLPDTVADRSIPVRMKRRSPDERVERFRRPLLQAEAAELGERVARWVTPHVEKLRGFHPELPETLSDRQQDGCEPLLAIADLAGGAWPNRARAALVEIFGGEAAEDNSVGVRLLVGISGVFSEADAERIFTTDLLIGLCDLDPQWLEFSYGKPLSATSLARLLKRFGISPRKVRIEDRTASGYYRDWFLDAWARYAPRKPEQVEQSRNHAGARQLDGLEQRRSVPAEQLERSALDTRGVPSVPPSEQGGRSGRVCYIHRTATEWWETPPGSGNWLCSKCHPNPAAASQLSARDLGFR